MDAFWHTVQISTLIGANLLVWPLLFKLAKDEFRALLFGDSDA